jgi:hypothetical protein
MGCMAEVHLSTAVTAKFGATCDSNAPMDGGPGRVDAPTPTSMARTGAWQSCWMSRIESSALGSPRSRARVGAARTQAAGLVAVLGPVIAIGADLSVARRRERRYRHAVLPRAARAR